MAFKVSLVWIVGVVACRQELGLEMPDLQLEMKGSDPPLDKRRPHGQRRGFVQAIVRVHQVMGGRMADPLVGVIMGSRSDWETMEHATRTLDALGVPHEVKVVSAHRTPDLLFEYAQGAEGRGLRVIVAGAGGAAHLPGMVAAKTLLPVLGVPVQSRALKGLDSLLSIVQMPGGVPVGTLAIGTAGAVNAALLAARILAADQPEIRQALKGYTEGRTAAVLADPDPTVPSA